MNSNNMMERMLSGCSLNMSDYTAPSTQSLEQWLHDVHWRIAPRYLYDEKYEPLLTYFNGRFADCTGTITDVGFTQIITEPFRGMPTSADDWEVICDRRALAIKQMSEEKQLPVAVMWSGGIDSTLVVCALLKNNVPFRLVFNKQSINEHPWLWFNVLKDETPDRMVKVQMDKPLQWLAASSRNYIIVTGEDGSQIMGTVSWEQLANTSRSLERIGTYGVESSRLLRHSTPLYGIPDHFKKLLMPLVDAAPRDFKFNYDYLWWILFAMRYEFAKHKLALYSNTLQPNLVQFFLSPDFVDWALVNDSRVKCPNLSWRYYKMPMRDYIYKYTGDDRAYEMVKNTSLARSHEEVGGAASAFDNRGYADEGDTQWIEDL